MYLEITNNSPSKKEHFVGKGTVGFLSEPHFKQHSTWAWLPINMSSFPVEHVYFGGCEKKDGALSSNNSRTLKIVIFGVVFCIFQAQTL